VGEFNTPYRPVVLGSRAPVAVGAAVYLL